MTSSVEIKTRGKRGGEFSAIKQTAQVVTFIDGSNNYISVDSFQGTGAAYQQREEARIEIMLGNVLWAGTAKELEKILSLHNKR